MSEFLLELLCEEIPARMQAQGAVDLVRLVSAGLKATQLSFDHIDSFVTPRRLGLVVNDLPGRQLDRSEERKGPRVDAPAAAIEGFLKSSGLAALDQAEIRETDKGSFYFAVKLLPGRPTPEALAAIVQDTLINMPWPKSMRWRDADFRWVRPLHGILALFDGTSLPLTFPLGARSDKPLLT
jgi:glycyl-tRNA synthetase beta chain